MDLVDFMNWYSTQVENNRAKLSSGFANEIHMILGMITELGELADNYKKYMAYGKETDLVNIKEELGDMIWYIVGLCNVLGLSLDDVMETNMRKLAKRYKNGFTVDEALNRNLDNERKELESDAN